MSGRALQVGVAVAMRAFYGAALVAARASLRRLLYPGALRPSRDGSCPDDARLVTLRADDGTPVHAIEVACVGPPRGTLVYFHGNGQTAADVVPLARLLADEGLRVLILEYRGYGLSREVAPPSESGIYADASALCATVVGEPVVLWGTSLGAAVAVEMARPSRGVAGLRALVLVCPFTSMRAICRRFMPLLPAALVARDVFDSEAKATELDVPALVVHGEADRLVPASMGRALAARIRGARFVGLPGVGHDPFPTHGDDVVSEVLAHIDGPLRSGRPQRARNDGQKDRGT